MKIAIIGAAYTGLAAAKYFKSLGHSISVTTTKESRREELEQVADKVTVMFGSDREKMKELLVDQDILVLTVAGGMVEKDGKPFMDLDLYKDAYVGTAESVADAIGSDSSLRQIIFTSSLNAYGDGGSADEISEDTEANPLNPFQQVYIATEDLLRNLENDQLSICIFRTGTIHGPEREWKNQMAQL
jgi:nucleoside-diphosphate-sugar epimerase